MPRFPNDRFPGFCKFHIEKKSFAVEINTSFRLRISSVNAESIETHG